MKRPEVLAPAGSPEALKAAVQAGADAVYLGGRLLNARRNAANFDDAALEEAVCYCHERGARVYLTLNTLVFENELKTAARAVEQACALGVDALILQDLGLLRLCRAAAPGMRLHASTQLSLHNLEGVEEAAALGFSRVVLARELSFEEIAAIAAHTPCELEIFVHGALCMSVSGQCYMSAVLGGRSGNRGLCAQPCRLPFSVPGGTGRDLSLKDLSLVEEIGRLSSVSVASLKIEGRMKRPEYVAAATRACLAAARGEIPEPEQLEELRSVFSRSGFTKGYFENRRGRGMFGARQYEDVVAAQGVLKGLHALYEGEHPRVKVDLRFTLKDGCPVQLWARDEDGNTAHIAGAVPEAARVKAVDDTLVTEKLSKTGGTPFYAESVTCDIGPGLSVPVAELNRMRREALAELLQKRGLQRPVAFDEKAAQALLQPPAPIRVAAPVQAGMHAVYRLRSLSQLCGEMNDAAFVFVPYETLAADTQRTAALLQKGVPLGAELPRVVFGGQQQLLQSLAALRGVGVETALCGNLGAVRLARKAGLRVFGDFGLNVTNSLAFVQLRELSVESCVLSFEQTLEQLRATAAPAPQDAAITVYGRLPLMLTRLCPLKNGTGCAECPGELTDRTGERLPVLCRGGLYSEILNTRPLWMLDRQGEAAATGAGYALLSFTTETCAQIEQVLKARRLGEKTAGEFTRGLYYRGEQ